MEEGERIKDLENNNDIMEKSEIKSMNKSKEEKSVFVRSWWSK